MKKSVWCLLNVERRFPDPFKDSSTRSQFSVDEVWFDFLSHFYDSS